MTVDGSVTEFKLGDLSHPSRDPVRIITGPGDTIWFTESADNKVACMTTAGAVTEFDLPTPNVSPWGIVTGPDANAWFTEEKGSRIGRVTLAGEVTEFPFPTPDAASAGAIAIINREGQLWFAEHKNQRLARMTPDGAVAAEYPCPTNCAPQGLAAASDGRVWYTDSVRNVIGRLVP
jgi:virginiamycin B lyase